MIIRDPIDKAASAALGAFHSLQLRLGDLELALGEVDASEVAKK